MKLLLNTTLLFLLVIGFSGGASGQDVETISGVGLFNQPNGDVYVGELSNGKFHGRGVYTVLTS